MIEKKFEKFQKQEMPLLTKQISNFEVGDLTNKGKILFIDATHDYNNGKTKKRWQRENGENIDLSVKTDKGWTKLSDIELLPKEEEITTDESIYAKLKPEIEFNDAMKLDIRICEILDAERVKGTDKLLHLTIDIGNENRTVITNIGSQFEPEDLLHKKMPFILNIKPTTIKKIESKGMIMVIEDNGKITLIESNAEVGSKLL